MREAIAAGKANKQIREPVALAVFARKLSLPAKSVSSFFMIYFNISKNQ
jgi:hypothetical protein